MMLDPLGRNGEARSTADPHAKIGDAADGGTAIFTEASIARTGEGGSSSPRKRRERPTRQL
jgi:hypothetical protein